MRKLIAFTGRKRSGKDTAAEILVDEEGYVDVKMAGGLKAMITAYFQHLGLRKEAAAALIEDEALKNKPTGYIIPMDNRRAAAVMADALFAYMGLKPEDRWTLLNDDRVAHVPISEFRNRVDVTQLLARLEWWLDTYAKAGATPRLLMQTLGTEWGRDKIYSDLWIDLFELRAKLFDWVVCTDVRFLNEAAVIRELGGTLIKIDAEERLGPNLDPHPSEQEMALIEADYVIENNGTLEDFLTTCRSTLEVIIE